MYLHCNECQYSGVNIIFFFFGVFENKAALDIKQSLSGNYRAVILKWLAIDVCETTLLLFIQLWMHTRLHTPRLFFTLSGLHVLALCVQKQSKNKILILKKNYRYFFLQIQFVNSHLNLKMFNPSSEMSMATIITCMCVA